MTSDLPQLPDDRILTDLPVIYYKDMYQRGYLLIYINNSVEIKCPGNHVVMTMDHFLETMHIAFELDHAVTGIMNTDEPEKSKLISHLNHEGQFWESDND